MLLETSEGQRDASVSLTKTSERVIGLQTHNTHRRQLLSNTRLDAPAEHSSKTVNKPKQHTLPPNVENMLKILSSTNEKYCNCDTGAAGGAVGYLCPGTCLDYIYDNVKRTKYAFALEIFDGEADLGYKNSPEKRQMLGRRGEFSSLLEVGKVENRSDTRQALQYSKFRNHNHNHHHHYHHHHDSDSSVLVELGSKHSHSHSHSQRAKSCFLQGEADKSDSKHNIGTHTSNSKDMDEEFTSKVRSRSHSKRSKTKTERFPSVMGRSQEYHCLRMFNPTTRDVYEATVENWSDAIIEITRDVIRTEKNAASPAA